MKKNIDFNFVHFRFQNKSLEMSRIVESKTKDAMEDDIEEEFEISEPDDIIADYVTNNHQNIHWKVTRT
jgi:hypothetical protein